MRLALVGVGKVARGLHLPALCGPGPCPFSLVATASRRSQVAGVPAFRGLDALLAAVPGIDALSICTPSVGRSALVKTALAAGCHVMLEKPPADTLGSLEAMARAAVDAGRTLFASWPSRKAAGVAPARAWLAQRRIDLVRVRWLEDIRVLHPAQDRLLDTGGFGVFDPGIDAFAILTRLLPDPVEVERALLVRPAGRQLAITAEIQARSGEIPVEIRLDYCHPGEPFRDIEVESGRHRLLLSQGGQRLRIDGADVSLAPVDEYASLYDRFAALIAAGRSDADDAPLRLVADAMLAAEWYEGGKFSWEERI